MLLMFTAGLCQLLNPDGAATYGWSAQEGPKEIACGCDFIEEGLEATVARASYHAIIRATAWIWKTGRKEEPVILHSSSQLVVSNLKGEWSITVPIFEPLHSQARRGLEGLTHNDCGLVWIPKERNTRAIELANHAYTKHTKEHGEGCAGLIKPLAQSGGGLRAMKESS